MARGKYRWFKMLLYPDNEVHRFLMDYLNSPKCTLQGCYILHEPETNEKKQHWHVICYSANSRSPDGFAHSFGKCECVTLKDGTKRETFDISGYEYTECDSRDILRYVLNADGTINDDLSNCSEIKDIIAFATYILHKDFKSMIEGKKEYDIRDIKTLHGDYEFISRLYQVDKTTETGSEIVRICNYISECQLYSIKDVMLTLYSNQEYDLIKYCEKHAYLITQLMKGG